MRAPLALALALALVARAASPGCEDAIVPFDGQTAVPLDAKIYLSTEGVPDWPEHQLARAVTLLDLTTGAPVPFTLRRLDDAVGATPDLVLTPDAPLIAGHTYRAEGLLTDRLPRGCGPAWPHRPTASTFTTTADPRPLAAHSLHGVDLFVRLSEPVHTASLAAALRIDTDAGPVTPLEADLAVGGGDPPSHGALFLVDLHGAAPGAELRVTAGVDAVSGARSAEDVVLPITAVTADTVGNPLDHWLGFPLCDGG